MSSTSSDTLLVALTFCILGLFFLFIFILWIRNSSSSSPALCQTGYCATNIFNGIKRCPESDSQIEFTSGIEVCNPRFSCEGQTPYSVQEDESTRNDGRCPEGIECRCVRTPFCPNYVSSTFTVVGGDPYTPFEGKRISVVQNSGFVNVLNVSSTIPPLQLTDNVTNFCSVPSSWLPHLWPQECQRGTLAYLTENVADFSTERDPLTCVSYPACPSGTNVFETKSNQMHCL